MRRVITSDKYRLDRNRQNWPYISRQFSYIFPIDRKSDDLFFFRKVKRLFPRFGVSREEWNDAQERILRDGDYTAFKLANDIRDRN